MYKTLYYWWWRFRQVCFSRLFWNYYNINKRSLMVLSNFRNKCHTLRRNFIMKIQIFSLFLVLALHSHLRGEAGPRIELQQDNSLRGSAWNLIYKASPCVCSVCIVRKSFTYWKQFGFSCMMHNKIKLTFIR